MQYSAAKQEDGKYIDSKFNRVLHSGPHGPGTRSPRRVPMFRIVALIAAAVAAILAVADSFPSGK